MASPTEKRVVTFDKPTPDVKLGIRLADDKRGVRIVEINPAGPLASLVAKGEIITKINGAPCAQGHQWH